MDREEEKEKVREATDLAALIGETVVLRPRGQELWGCCPFHHEKSPSFHVRPQLGTWKCFGCGKGGDCFTFVMERDNVDFRDALRVLAARAGIELTQDVEYDRKRGSTSKRARLREAVAAAEEFFRLQLTRVRGEGPDRARAYLAGRGMGLDVARSWGLGYAPGNGALVAELTRRGFTRRELVDARLAVERGGRLRDFFYDRVMIPIRDDAGHTVAFGGRILQGEGPKYVNSPDSALYHKSKTVFALDRAKSHITATSEAIVVEGYFDAIAMHRAGFENAVAPCGTAFPVTQLTAIAKFLPQTDTKLARGRVVFFQDADDAGLKASERALQHVSATTAALYRVVLPEAKDPDEYLRDHSADELRAVLDAPVPLARFVVDRHIERFDTSSPEGRAVALADVAQAMGPLKGTSLADDYVQYVAGRLMVDVSTVKGALAQVRWVAPRVFDEDDEGEEAPSPALCQPALADGPGFGAGAPAVPAPRPSLLPDDARMVRVEHEVLSLIASNVDAAREAADRVAGIVWADPRDEAMAWALLSTPEGTTPLQALSAAEAVVPEAAEIIADGDVALMDETDEGRALSILLDDLEIRSLRRQIDQGRGRLKVADAAADPDGFNDLFTSLTDLQRRLQELESRIRTIA